MNHSLNIKQGRRLRELRETLELNQDEFGRGINTSRTTLWKWERGREEIPENIYPLLQSVYNLNPLWLLTGEGEMFLEGVRYVRFEDVGEAGSEEFKVKKISKLNEQINRISQKAEPFLRIWGITGAGDRFDIHMQETDPEHFKPMETIKVSGILEHQVKDAFRVRGESMSPVIRHGALVGVDFKYKRFVGSEIYVLNLPHEGLTVKQVFPEGKRTRVHSFADTVPDFFLEFEEVDQYLVVGRVVWIMQETNKM